MLNESCCNRALPILSKFFFAVKLKGDVKHSGYGNSAANGSYGSFLE